MSESQKDLSAFHPLRMGLAPLPLADWLSPRDDDGKVLIERARVIATYGDDVLAALPEADTAVEELVVLLRERGFAISPGNSSLLSLAAIGHAVAEDLCILTPAEDASYRLTAGLLCFPNRWRLKEKLGGSVLAVHGPVPDYAAHISHDVDRFLTRLRPERAFVRSNWGLAGAADLFLPEPIPAVDPQDDGAVFLRREDQSFLKLPRTGAVIFSIRTTVTPWTEVLEEERAGIVATIRDLPPAWLAYKSIRPPG